MGTHDEEGRVGEDGDGQGEGDAMEMEELTEIHEEVFPLWEVPHGGVEAGSEKKAERQF